MEQMRYKTSLTSLEIFAYHGLYEEEKVLGATFLVDASIEYEVSKSITSIEEATNYEIMFKIIHETMSIRQDLLETVAQLIIDALRKAFTGTQHIEVTIHKPNPGGLFKSGIASVTMTS
jgi:dihydroneopterin aldolase